MKEHNTGNVRGPASSTDGNIAVYDGTTGRLVKDGGTVAAVVGSAAPQAHAASHVAADAIQSATAAQAGLATAAQITKLDGIEAGADVCRGVWHQEIHTGTTAPGNTFVYRLPAPFACTVSGIRIYYQTLGASALGTYLFSAAGDGAENLLSAATVSLEVDTLTAATLYTCALTATAADLAIASGGLITVTIASNNADLVGQAGGFFDVLYTAT
jgi:hypothetical protein